MGNFARLLLGESPRRAEIGLHGSFAATGKGHGTDLALVGGLLGFLPDDARIRDSVAWAAKMELSFAIQVVDLGPDVHPNAASIKLWGESGLQTSIVGVSVGGGEIEIIEIDGFSIRLAGEYDSLVAAYRDRPGVIAAVTQIIASAGVNIAQMTVRRREKGDEALMVVEVDQPLDKAVTDAVGAIEQVYLARAISAN